VECKDAEKIFRFLLNQEIYVVIIWYSRINSDQAVWIFTLIANPKACYKNNFK